MQLLHQPTFVPTNLHTKQLLLQQPLHQTAFTPTHSLYSHSPLHRTPLTPDNFYTKPLSHQKPFTPAPLIPKLSLYTRQLLHQPDFISQSPSTYQISHQRLPGKGGGTATGSAGTRWKPEHKRTPATRITDGVPKCCPCHANLTETATATRQCTRAETRCLSCPYHSVGAAPAKQINPRDSNRNTPRHACRKTSRRHGQQTGTQTRPRDRNRNRLRHAETRAPATQSYPRDNNRNTSEHESLPATQTTRCLSAVLARQV